MSDYTFRMDSIKLFNLNALKWAQAPRGILAVGCWIQPSPQLFAFSHILLTCLAGSAGKHESIPVTETRTYRPNCSCSFRSRTSRVFNIYSMREDGGKKVSDASTDGNVLRKVARLLLFSARKENLLLLSDVPHQSGRPRARRDLQRILHVCSLGFLLRHSGKMQENR